MEDIKRSRDELKKKIRRTARRVAEFSKVKLNPNIYKRKLKNIGDRKYISTNGKIPIKTKYIPIQRKGILKQISEDKLEFDCC